VALTDEQILEQVVAEVNDDGTVAQQWGFIYDWAEEQALDIVSETSRYFQRLRYQYALLKSCDTLLGSVREHVDSAKQDRKLALDQLTKHLRSKRDEALAEIECLRKTARATGRASSTGVMTTKAPLSGPVGGPDPNSTYYSGDYTKVAPDYVTE